MAKNSKISWCDHSWNPVTGCSEVSPGCDNCYARELTHRWGRSFDVTLKPKLLGEPAKWKQPGMVFVNSMSDLFHREIPKDFLEKIWYVMIENDQHIYQILSKRPHRMAHVIKELGLPVPEYIWLGTSIENQTFADNRIPALLSIDAPIKWLSCEPLLGPLTIFDYLAEGGIDWVVSGGESGPKRRPAPADWFRQIRDDCRQQGVAFYFKQGNHLRPGNDRELDGRTWEEYPPLRHPALERVGVLAE